jgi:hypothetical protein
MSDIYGYTRPDVRRPSRLITDFVMIVSGPYRFR